MGIETRRLAHLKCIGNAFGYIWRGKLVRGEICLKVGKGELGFDFREGTKVHGDAKRRGKVQN